MTRKDKKAKRELKPRLRFPEFRYSSDWVIREFGEFLAERDLPLKSSIPLYSLTIEDGIIPKSERYERAFLVKDEKDAYKQVFPNDFAYNPMNLRFGAIARHYGSSKVALSKYYNIFFCNSTVDSKFCEYYFKSSRMISYYNSVAIGTLVEKKRVHFSDFLSFRFPFPVLAEQQKIADCLSSLDELITAQTQKVDALKAHKKVLMLQLFPAEGENVPKLRFSKFRNTSPWSVELLGNISENLDYRRIPITESDRVAGSIPYYGASGIIDYVNEFLFDEELLCISEDGANLVARATPIAFSISGKSWVNNHAHVLKFSKIATQKLVENYLNFIKLDDFLTGMAQPKLNKAKLDIIPIPIPCIDEQCMMADFLSSIDELITAHGKTLNALKTFKRGLMQQLFPVVEEE